jgi:hypothetical protein
MLAQTLGLLLTLFTFADEPKSGALMQTLPADGAWVTFDVNVKLNGQEFVLTAPSRPNAQAKLPGPPRRTWSPQNRNGGPGQLQPLVRLVSSGTPAFRLAQLDACEAPRKMP